MRPRGFAQRQAKSAMIDYIDSLAGIEPGHLGWFLRRLAASALAGDASTVARRQRPCRARGRSGEWAGRRIRDRAHRRRAQQLHSAAGSAARLSGSGHRPGVDVTHPRPARSSAERRSDVRSRRHAILRTLRYEAVRGHGVAAADGLDQSARPDDGMITGAASR